MTIAKVLSAADALVRNYIPKEQKLAWLSELDGRIKLEIMEPCGAAQDIPNYDEHTPDDGELLVPAPYGSLYIDWLEMQIARYNGEQGRYDNAYAAFSAKWDAFAAWWIRTHPRKTPHITFPTWR